MVPTRALLVLLLLPAAWASLSCAASRGLSSEPVPAAARARSGVSHGELARILVEHWEASLSRDPVEATRLGDHRFDDRIADRSKAARDEDLRRLGEWRERARVIPEDELDDADRITRALFTGMLGAELETASCAHEEWNLSASDNPVAEWNNLAELHPVSTPKDASNLVARYRQAPRAIDVDLENLERGVSSGVYASAESLRRVIEMLRSALAAKVEDWPMFAPALGERAGWSEAEREGFRRDLREALEGGVRPALARYLAFLVERVAPNARGDDRPGLASLPFGERCYAAEIRHHTTLDPAPTPAELHRIGQEEIARINAEMSALGQKLFGTSDLPRILERLRTDRALYFSTSEEVEEKARRALEVARARIPEYFGILPKAECVVARIPDYEAPFTTVAYYRQPVPDGTRPGQYFVNVYKPETRTRYEAEALAFHESIPGHHLQIAIAQELPELPEFRKHLLMTAYVEGWALYAEQLADEMGLFAGDLDRMGKLSYESWRASRLVVDTGLHALGWSRQAAKDYMLAHTALAPNNIDNEVDRYIVWPGQALAYKTGQLELGRLRRQAEGALGDRFDVRRFHDVVLGRGALSLPILRAQVEAWIRGQRS